jgi:hypothetical protein
MFNDKDFIPLPVPPGPNDTLLLTVSLPTPITAVTPKHLTPTDDDSSTEHRLLLNNDSPTLGRLSRDKQKALTEGFVALDQLAKEIAEASGLSVTQIVEWWNGGAPCTAKIHGTFTSHTSRKIWIRKSSTSLPTSDLKVCNTFGSPLCLLTIFSQIYQLMRSLPCRELWMKAVHFSIKCPERHTSASRPFSLIIQTKSCKHRHD